MKTETNTLTTKNNNQLLTNSNKMEKLKRNTIAIVALLIALVASFTFTSCSKDDEESEIVGTWRGYLEYDYDDIEYCIFVFKKDGKYTLQWGDNSDLTDFAEHFGTYNYDSKKNILTLNGVDEDGDHYIERYSCFISGNRMVLTSDDYDDDTMVLTKM